MSTLIASADGDFTGTSTWSYSNYIAYRNEEANQYTVLTAYPVWASVGKFTPGAAEIDGIGIKLAARLGTTGTLTISLQDASGVAVLDGTTCEVTLDIATDVPYCTAADLNGGWLFVKFATPVTPLDGTQYGINVKTSNASQIRLWGSSNTLTSISRLVRLTETVAPIAGDNFIITKEWTAAGTGTTRTVTYNETAATDYGSASTSLITPAISICNGGTLQSGTTAATNYVLKVSGNIVVYSGGTLNIGTSGTPIPSGGSFTLTFDCGTNVDYGLVVRNLGTWNAYGTKGFTSSPSNHFTLLNADEAAGQATIGAVGDTTGWEVDDEICFSSTTRTYTEHQMCKIKTIDSSTQFTMWVAADAKAMSNGSNAAVLTAAKSGTNSGNEDTRCEIGNLTRNVKIQGASTTLQCYVYIGATATVTLRKTEFRYLGSSTSGKRGIDIATTTGTFDMQYCSVHTCTVTGSYAFSIPAVTGSGITISNNVVYNCHTLFINVATTGTWTVSGNLFCYSIVSSSGVTLGDIGGTFTNNFITSTANVGLTLSEPAGIIGTISGNVVHSANSAGIALSGGLAGTISSLRSWRNTTTGSNLGNINIDMQLSETTLILDGLICFGASSRNVCISSGHIRLVNPILFGGTTLMSGYGIVFGSYSNYNATNSGNLSIIEVENGSFSGHTISDLAINGTAVGPRMVMHNTTLGSTTELSYASASNGFNSSAFITSMKHNGATGLHKTWKRGGRTTGGGAALEIDTTIYNTASPSLRMYPGSASIKLESSTWEVAVASGTTLTPSVYVRESVVGDGTDYNGNRIRLCVKRHVAAGISADTVIATATSSSEGAWELISGTTVSVTDDAILEFFVDCDGTTGWINVDDFSCVGANPNGLKYWSPNHAGPLALGLPAGGGLIGGGNINGGLQ